MEQILKINYEPCTNCRIENSGGCQYFVESSIGGCTYRNQREINTQFAQIQTIKTGGNQK